MPQSSLSIGFVGFGDECKEGKRLSEWGQEHSSYICSAGLHQLSSPNDNKVSSSSMMIGSIKIYATYPRDRFPTKRRPLLPDLFSSFFSIKPLLKWKLKAAQWCPVSLRETLVCFIDWLVFENNVHFFSQPQHLLRTTSYVWMGSSTRKDHRPMQATIKAA